MYMFPLIFKTFVYLNILIIIFVSFFLMFSKKNEPKEFPEKFSKKYILKASKIIKKVFTIFMSKHYINVMKNEYSSNDLKKLEDKIDKLQKSVNKLEKKLCNHIEFIDRVYEPLRSPISKIKNFFG